MSCLPVPAKPYPDWSRFVTALWEHGSKAENLDPFVLGAHMDRAKPLIEEALTRASSSDAVRPSSFLACARQTFFMAQGHTPEPMPDNIGITFAMGHFFHEMAYAIIKSALPPCFRLLEERDVDLGGSWWPAHDRFNQKGSADMVLSCFGQEEDVRAYLAEGQPKEILGDFKSMGDFSFKKHSRADFEEEPDGFGYLSQLAVYTDALGIIGSGALLIGFNRSSPTFPVRPRLIEPHILIAERDRLKQATAQAVAGTDPGEEFLERHGKQAHFYCGRSGRSGYCGFRERCKAAGPC